jgi:hypothetical protein
MTTSLLGTLHFYFPTHYLSITQISSFKHRDTINTLEHVPIHTRGTRYSFEVDGTQVEDITFTSPVMLPLSNHLRV